MNFIILNLVKNKTSEIHSFFIFNLNKICYNLSRVGEGYMNKKGFTLIEVIVSLALLSLIGVAVGISLNKIFKN